MSLVALTNEERPTIYGLSLAYVTESRTRVPVLSFRSTECRTNAPICHTKARTRMRAIPNLIQLHAQKRTCRHGLSLAYVLRLERRIQENIKSS